jgi:hypothetical protein
MPACHWTLTDSQRRWHHDPPTALRPLVSAQILQLVRNIFIRGWIHTDTSKAKEVDERELLLR